MWYVVWVVCNVYLGLGVGVVEWWSGGVAEW
jgi:hypothetical protein